MNKSSLLVRNFILVSLVFMLISCRGPSNSNIKNNDSFSSLPTNLDSQLGEYIINIFEDSKGNLWFGTLTKGVAKYDRKSLKYYTMDDGLNGNRVGDIVEDAYGNLWFGTHAGISKYDGQTFTSFTENDGLCDNRISNLLLDKSGSLWVGTWGGVCKFNGSNFESFPIPKPNIQLLPYQTTMNWSTEIFEDAQGNIWFGRDGYGATKYDGENFIHFTKNDGLISNNIQDIQEDKLGNIWFGARIAEKDHPDQDKRLGAGGLIKFDGENFTSFPAIDGLYNSDVYQIYRDSRANLWISTINNGIYKYNGKEFINYAVTYSGEKTSKAVVTVLEDSKGTIWIGCAGGLFRLDAVGAVNITTKGPWN